ncbi:pro-sigmaK processing inhibitor BofA family protein [Ruminococcus sp.]|uniref:pro-sigmaK processing inhibitor BofA family protein n=1 Tax=Ruminococcus sp. TaxID=41978 RepID=UPI0039948959
MMFLYYMRRVHKIRSFLAGACSGLLALLLVHYAGTWIGYSPALNLLHVLQAGILGVPGVILMVCCTLPSEKLGQIKRTPPKRCPFFIQH